MKLLTTIFICIIFFASCSDEKNDLNDSDENTVVADTEETNDNETDLEVIPDESEDETADTDSTVNDETETDSDVIESDEKIDEIADEDAINPDDYIIPPEVTCKSSAAFCDQTVTQDKTFAMFRRDYYFPNSLYNEYTDEPVDGKRFMVAAISQVTGTVTEITVDGKNVDEMLVKPQMEWYHVWPKNVVSGEPVWFAFHSHNPKWNSASTAQLVIKTAEGNAVDTSFDVGETKVDLTYVTATRDMSNILIFLKNTDSVSRTLTKLYVNGREVFESGVACIPDSTIDSMQSVMWKVPLCDPTSPGKPWTVIAEFDQINPAVGAGRIIRPEFPIETWPSGSQCPFPTALEDNYETHKKAGFDSYYIYAGGRDKDDCHYSTKDLINNVASLHNGDFNILIGDDFLHQPEPLDEFITDSTYVTGFLTGDESDGKIWEGENEDEPAPANKAAKARRLWDMYPEIPVYNGAKTNKNVGSFAGMVDIQGIDLYVAACAPHITNWGTHPPLRAAYDYLRNARNNHMPLTTWFYAQGLSSVWNKDALIGGGEIHVQPDPQEILAQAFSVPISGGKGLMWFMSDLEEKEHKEYRWDAIRTSNRIIRGVREYLREGDITGAVFSNENILVDMIRSERALIIPVVSLETDPEKDPTDIKCGASLTSELAVPHWTFVDYNVNLDVFIPEDFGVVDIFEVLDGFVTDLPYSQTINGRQLTLSQIPFNNAMPARMIVLAADENVRQEVIDEMNSF